jgi:hypothetical protein
VIGFIDHFQALTSSNYNTIANLHILQITTVQSEPSQCASTSRFPVTDLNKLQSGEYTTTELLLQLTDSQAGGHLTPPS